MIDSFIIISLEEKKCYQCNFSSLLSYANTVRDYNDTDLSLHFIYAYRRNKNDCLSSFFFFCSSVQRQIFFFFVVSLSLYKLDNEFFIVL